jgi:hypothetical protein
MNHRILTLIGCAFLAQISTSLFAQSFNAGALIGANASQVGGDGYSGFNKAGLIVGAYTDIDISTTINLQLEINYSQKGSRHNPNTEEGDTDFFLMRLDYIEIPVMARYQNNKFTFEGGVYYGQLINEYLEDENGAFDIPPELNKFKSSDFGALIGVNFNFTENIIMNWRFNQSVMPIRRHDSGASWIFDRGMLHSYLSFTMRYEFIGGN